MTISLCCWLSKGWCSRKWFWDWFEPHWRHFFLFTRRGSPLSLIISPTLWSPQLTRAPLVTTWVSELGGRELLAGAGVQPPVARTDCLFSPAPPTFKLYCGRESNPFHELDHSLNSHCLDLIFDSIEFNILNLNIFFIRGTDEQIDNIIIDCIIHYKFKILSYKTIIFI